MRKLGFDVKRIQQLGMTGAEDDKVFEKAQELKVVLVTNDKGFGDIRQYPPSSHYGMIVFKMAPDPVCVRQVHETLKQLLRTEDQFEGALFIVLISIEYEESLNQSNQVPNLVYLQTNE